MSGEAGTTREYNKDGVTVVWKPRACIHSGRCVLWLGSVFNNQVHPWVNMDGAPVERIIEQVNKCPSGALSFRNS